jgi:hypothetical protein
MSFGQVTDQQACAIQPFILGRVVHDLGCGDRYLSKRLVAWGAKTVIAVDKDPYGYDPGPKVITVAETFERYLKMRPIIDVAFISWPTNSHLSFRGVENPTYALLRLVISAARVVYLGKNTDGIICGHPHLFRHLVRRPLLAHVPDEFNTLLAYDAGTVTREPVLEEQAGMDMSRVYRSVPAKCPAEAEET